MRCRPEWRPSALADPPAAANRVTLGVVSCGTGDTLKNRVTLMVSIKLRRAATRAALVIVATAAGVVALPLAAQAHVEIKPDKVEGGDFAVVAFRVPNEREHASTTRLRVLLPSDHPIADVQTTPMPGWTVTTRTRTLAKPVEMEGSKVTSVVSQVTWRATGPGIRSGQFQDFALNLGPLPTTGTLTFTALQTYSTGEQVRWNEVSADGSVEPEHPAPTLTLTAPSARDVADTQPISSRGGSDTTTLTAGARSADTSLTLPIGLSLAALVMAGAAFVLAVGLWRRGRV
jgi:uncharacterized protein YcnI